MDRHAGDCFALLAMTAEISAGRTTPGALFEERAHALIAILRFQAVDDRARPRRLSSCGADGRGYAFDALDVFAACFVMILFSHEDEQGESLSTTRNFDPCGTLARDSIGCFMKPSITALALCVARTAWSARTIRVWYPESLILPGAASSV